MHLADLKRAVEDVLLQPDVNDVTKSEARASIAALDLCQVSTSLFVISSLWAIGNVCFATNG